MVSRTTLITTVTGTIDIATVDNQAQFLQFNCSCLDALPYCKAMCCKIRHQYAVKLEPGEEKKFFHETRKVDGEELFNIIAPNTIDDNVCVYLQAKDNKCRVHEDKPKACKNWHCSPMGVGLNLEVRGHGWILIPTQGLKQ